MQTNRSKLAVEVAKGRVRVEAAVVETEAVVAEMAVVP